MYVFDATPLIYLGTVERLSLLDHVDRQCVMPAAVYEEIVEQGLAGGYADAGRVDRAVETGFLDVVDTEEIPSRTRLANYSELTRADRRVLALAADRNGVAIMDDRYGRTVADAEGIETRGTAYLILELLRDGAIESAVARSTIDQIVDEGWYCSPDLYATIIRRIEDLA